MCKEILSKANHNLFYAVESTHRLESPKRRIVVPVKLNWEAGTIIISFFSNIIYCEGAKLPLVFGLETGEFTYDSADDDLEFHEHFRNKLYWGDVECSGEFMLTDLALEEFNKIHEEI